MSLDFSISANLEEMEKNLSRAKNDLEKFAKNGSKSLDQFEKRAKKVGGFMTKTFTAGIAVAGGALLGLAQNVGNTADRLLDLAEITGMSTEAIQEYQFVAQQAGVSTETVTRATEGLVRRLKETGDAGSSAEKSLQRLGITTKTTDGNIRNAGDIMDETISKLAMMENTTERNALANEVFGRAWTDLAPILSMGADGIDQARARARELGVVLDNDALEGANAFRQATAELTAQMTGLKNQIGAKLAPVLTKLIPVLQSKLTPIVQRLGDFIENALNWFDGLSSEMKSFIGIVTAVVAGIGPLLLALGGIASILPAIASGLALLTGPIGLVVAGITGLTIAIVKNWDTIKQWAEDVANFFIKLYNESIVFRAGIEVLIFAFKQAFENAKFYFGALWDVVKTIAKLFINQFRGIGDVIIGAFTLDTARIKKGFDTSAKAMAGSFREGINSISDRAKNFTDNLQQNTENALNNILSGKKEPVTFESSQESKEKLKEDVAKSVSEGVQMGLGGRAPVSGVSSLEGGSVQMGDANPVANLTMQPAIETISDEMAELMQLFRDFDAELSDVIMGNIANTMSQLGDSIGQAIASGQSVLGAVGDTLINAFSGFLSDMGDLLIKYGLLGQLKGKLDTAIAVGGPAAIAAGVAATALGVALKAAGSALGNRSSGGFGGGGSGGGSGADPATSASFSAGSGRDSVQRFVVSGNDLVTVVDRARSEDSLIG